MWKGCEKRNNLARKGSGKGEGKVQNEKEEEIIEKMECKGKGKKMEKEVDKLWKGRENYEGKRKTTIEKGGLKNDIRAE